VTADEFGSLADETARFLTVLINAAGKPAAGPEDGHEVCQWCPICRGAQIVLGSNPEIRAHLTHAITSFAQAVVLAMAQPANGATSRAHEGVERIDLDADDTGAGHGFVGADEDWPQDWPDVAPEEGA
jgi:hypothetical protein